MKTILLAALLALATPALADGDIVPPVRDALTLKECGQCHMAFQPAFLPAESWRRMMANLADHFGDNATMTADKAKAIEAYLVANAGRGRKGGEAADRITETRWFLKEHRFSDRVWQRPEVVTKSNCPACHQAAEQGVYEDD